MKKQRLKQNIWLNANAHLVVRDMRYNIQYIYHITFYCFQFILLTDIIIQFPTGIYEMY